VLGFHHLIEPDEYEGKKKFKANFHFTDDGFAKLEDVLRAGLEAAKDGFLKECDKAEWVLYEGKKKTKETGEGWEPPHGGDVDVEAWLSEKRREVTSDKAASKDDFIQLGAAFKEGQDRETGRRWQTSVKAWDAKGNLLDLKKLSPGSGTVCLPVVEVGIFANALFPEETPTIKLIGIQVLKLERWSGGGNVGAVSEEEINELVGDDDLDIDDLSAFQGMSISDEDPEEDDTENNDADGVDSSEPPV
jgi:hypothetical protein